MRVALLEIGAAAAAHHQAIAGKRHAAVVEHIGQAAIGMARGLAHQQIAAAKGDDVVLHQIAVGARRTALGGQRDTASGPLLQQPRAGHMVGMDMGFERVDELQAELGDQRRVAPDLLEHRVDDDRGPARAVAEQIGVGRGWRVEELPKHQHRPTP